MEEHERGNKDLLANQLPSEEKTKEQALTEEEENENVKEGEQDRDEEEEENDVLYGMMESCTH